MLVIGLVGLITLAVLLTFAFRIDYAPLYGDQSAEAAGEMKAYLEGRGIPVRVVPQPDGRYTIQVPQSQVPSLQLDVSTAGYLKKDPDVLSVLANSNLFMSESERRLWVNEGVAGKLTTSYKSLDGVADAIVNLNIETTPQTYGARKGRSSAMIILMLKPGYYPSEASIRGMINMAACSVPNLAPEDITLVDQTGQELYEPENPLSLNSTVKLHDLEEVVANNIRRRLTADLGKVFGFNNFIVLVSVQFNTESTTETSRSFIPIDPEDPTAGVIISQETGGAVGGSEVAGAIPGSTANVPNVAAQVQSLAGDGGTYWFDIVNYDYSEVLRETISQPGSSRAVAASVTVNSRFIPGDADSIKNYQTIIQGYLGREALVTVVAVDFFDDSDPVAVARAEQMTFYRNIAFASALAIIVVAVLIFTWRYLAARRKRLAEEEAEMAAQLALQQEVRLPDSQPSIQDKQRMQIVDELNRLALNKPEEFAKLVIAWMEEG